MPVSLQHDLCLKKLTTKNFLKREWNLDTENVGIPQTIDRSFKNSNINLINWINKVHIFRNRFLSFSTDITLSLILKYKKCVSMGCQIISTKILKFYIKFHFNKIAIIFLRKFLEDKSPFCLVSDTPVLDFLWRLLWVSQPEWAASFAHGGGVRVTRIIYYNSQ